jgi:hypothetical protein
MTVIVGVIGAAVLFGLFSMLRPRDKAGCTGHCAGCAGDGEGACKADGVKQ